MHIAQATLWARGRSKRLPMRTVILLACAAMAACTASAAEVAPHEADDPTKALFFPTAAAVSPDDAFLFVANANSELRYDSGSVIVFDLATVDQIAGDWTATKAMPAGCSPDPDHIETLVCGASSALIPHAGARIGNFATDIAVQDFKAGGPLRLIVPVRGDPSVTWIDWDGSKLNCNASGENFSLCDEDHRLAYVHNDPNIGLLPNEPFDAYAGKDFAIVTDLSSGAISLIDSPPGGNAIIADVLSGLFSPDPQTGLRGSTGVAGRGDSGIVYVGSRSEDRIQTLTVGRPVNSDIAPPFIIPEEYFFLDTVGGNAGGSSDTRGMAFSANGDRMYLINRRPPSLQIFDTSLDASGFPRNQGIAATDLCREASTLAVMDAGDGDRAYVTCFQDGEIYVVDPRGQSSVEDIITVGRGPYAVVAAPTRKKVYVTNFLEDTIAVVDVSPTSPTHDRVVLRIGEPKAP
jgi:DNA-binding beta-propeller fold protein YncE